MVDFKRRLDERKLKGNILKMEAHDSNQNTVRIEHVISVGLIGARSKMQEFAIKETRKDIMRITGTIHAFTTVTKDSQLNGKQEKRDTVYIKGMIKALDLVNGTVFISGQLILPDSASGYVQGIISQHEGHAIELDLMMSVEKADKSMTGYKYIATLMNNPICRHNGCAYMTVVEPKEPKSL